MDDLDRALIGAFYSVWERCAADPAEARRRWLRVQGGAEFGRPSRAWCLGVRASDTRLSAWFGLQKWERNRQPHAITLSAADVREICAPVWLRHPGVPLEEAAARIGRHPEAMRRWLPVRPGRSRDVRAALKIEMGVDYKTPPEDAAVGAGATSAAGGVPGWGVRYENPRAHGRTKGGVGGGWVPVVWSRRPIDPGHQNGARPHAVWGSLWEGLAARWPEGAGLWADRIPRYRSHPRPRKLGVGGTEAEREAHARAQWRGWDWLCPGLDAGGCGRRAGVLLCPLPAWTVGAYLADDPAVRRGLDVGEARRWRPGVDETAYPAAHVPGGLRFACRHCWKVRNETLIGHRGWGDFVGRISGGLLYGREVARVA